LGDYDKESTQVGVIIPRKVNGKYTFTLSIKTKNGQSKSASCTLYQRARLYVRYSNKTEASIDLFNIEEGYSKLVKTGLISDGYLTNYKCHFTTADGIIPEGSCLWVMVPPGIATPEKYWGNGFEGQLQKEDGVVKVTKVDYNGCKYSCVRGAVITTEDSYDVKVSFADPK
jgi:hypothetical protein